MSTAGPLSVLLVEDSEDDALLVVRELRRGGYDVDFERVEVGDAMAAALARRTWDVIIADYSLPGFDAPAAFEVLRAHGADIPFIIVSGTMGEETAVGAMKLGVHDYLLKGKLARLVPVVQREVREAKVRVLRRETEAALRASELRFRRLADSGIIGVTIVDGTGRVLEANDAFLDSVGYSREDLAAGRIDSTKLTPPEWANLNAAALERLRTHGAAKPWEKEYLRKDGGRTPVLVAAAALEGAQVISLSVDLSARKRLEEQLQRAQKMDAIGRLAGGVAHDFNNLMTVILSYAGSILSGTTPSDPLHADVDEMRKAAERAADLTRQLLAFSRQQMLQPRILDLNQVVSGMDRMLRRLLGEAIELSIRTASSVGKVLVDHGQVEQVIVNLVVNARDAMPKGGKVSIEIANVDLDAEYAAALLGVAPGQYVMMAVTDTGSGMDQATVARIFEPFFTTKDLGRGTGLGLSTVFGIVKQSGGHIWVYSEEGRGSTFKVYFPRSEGQVETTAAAASLKPGAIGRGSETVLLVEDDEQVRTVIGTILRRYGYQVIVAENGGEAFLVCEQNAGRIHLLLTDVVMPHMSGRELAERLRPLRPEMKVLYVSGYTEDSVVHHGVLDAGVAFVQKPFTPDLLIRKVRELLDEVAP
jgi:PAS domain S-box-containing protein